MERKIFHFKGLSTALSIVVILLSLPFTLLAEATPAPLTVIQSGADRAMKLIRTNCQPGQTITLKHHRAEIEQLVRDYCDFAEMAMRSLGPNWRSQPPAKQQEFVKLFEQMLFNTYIDRVDTHACGDEKITYDGESIDGTSAVVKSRVTGYKDREVTIEYRLRLKNNEWRAYDIVIEGVSLVNNYRQQFNAILARESFDGLLNRMRNKVTEFK
jgi:phospholipid transport system substrate-binding protein